ncbi:hypothetical protein I4U23_002028 [Adineta vaga]|nr:hypothetical protein I4U23_002028 [Adineta vaga]
MQFTIVSCIEHSIDNEQVCEHRCSTNNRCSMARFNRQFHRCDLFQSNHKNSLYRSYRSNYIHSKSTNCPERIPLISNIRQLYRSIIHCIYDALPWQHAQRSNIFQSYTLIGNSYLACQELCSSVRHCAGVQYHTRGVQRHQCQLLRSTKPWELVSSKTWTVFAKRSCYGIIDQNDPLSHDQISLCNFEYFGQGQHKYDREIIHALSHLSETQCQYICSTMVNCIGIEFIEKKSRCILLSPNFIQNDGTIDVKYHRRHHLFMKISCGTSLSECSLTDQHCNCHEYRCQHGTCVSRQKEGYYHMFCDCDHGFSGQLCEQQIRV